MRITSLTFHFVSDGSKESEIYNALRETLGQKSLESEGSKLFANDSLVKIQMFGEMIKPSDNQLKEINRLLSLIASVGQKIEKIEVKPI